MGKSRKTMGISRDSFHKRRKTGGKLTPWSKKRKFELGRPPSMTKIGGTRIHTVRVRGGSMKYRALRLDSGNFAWPTESVTKRTRVLNVVYNASNNELLRTNTLVKKSAHVLRKLKARDAAHTLAREMEAQFIKGRLLAKVSSRPGQSGRCDGYIIEGVELKFYDAKMAKK